MRRGGLPLGLALILITNVIVLIGVARNRAGEPDAVLEVTERELALPYSREEDTAISLHVRWSLNQEERWFINSPDWFDQAKLESLGYDCSVPLNDPSAKMRYGKARTREVFLVLEYEGEAWKRWLTAQEAELAVTADEVKRQEKTPHDLEEARERFERSRLTNSRLFVVDAGLDAPNLRRQYQGRSRFLITPGTVQLEYSAGGEDTEHLRGVIHEILIGEINVPRDRRGLLDEILAREEQESQQAGKAGRWQQRWDQEPRYKVRLRYGRRYEPWVTEVVSFNPTDS